ncbi:reverse transcriptase domain-containing protein [Tanacetum coccineum]
MAENSSNKRKWKGDQGGSSSQNKGHKVIRAHTVRPSNKKVYARKFPQYNRCKLHHTGPCFMQCSSYKRIGHQTRDCRAPTLATTPRPLVAKQKIEVTCYECGRLGHYKSDCPRWKDQNPVNKQWKGKARGDSSVMTNNANA